MDGVTVRRATTGDAIAIAVIEAAWNRAPWSPSAIASDIEHPASCCLVAERDGMVCGYLLAWAVAPDLDIHAVAVKDTCRRAGIASALLDAAARASQEQGCRRITLEVRSGNADARAFYEARMFRQSGTRRRYYADSGEDAILLEAEIP